MKRTVSLVSVLALVLALAAPVLAGEAAPTTTTLQGWITDSYCGAKNANAEGAACAKDCYKNGAKLELVAGGKTYKISDQKAALEHVGHEVVVTGTLDHDTIKVSKIEAAKKDKA